MKAGGEIVSFGIVGGYHPATAAIRTSCFLFADGSDSAACFALCRGRLGAFGFDITSPVTIGTFRPFLANLTNPEARLAGDFGFRWRGGWRRRRFFGLFLSALLPAALNLITLEGQYYPQ